MKQHKSVVYGLSMLVALTMTACGTKEAPNQSSTNNSEQPSTSKQMTSSSVEDEGFIPQNLTELSSEELVKTITEFGHRMSGSEENAKVGKLIKTYFEKVGLQPYKNDSYYHSFNANSGISFRDPDTGKEQSIDLQGNLENVVAKIKGEDSTKAIIVSAHFDTFFDTNGVLDNASGTAALLQASKNIMNQLQQTTYPVDMIFVAFNAEEQYLIGSQAFYEEVSKDYKEFYNINIDCVGAKDKALAYKNSHSKSTELYKDLETYLDKYQIAKGNVDYMKQGMSDNAVFQDGGRAAVILGEEELSEIIHTPKDNDLSLVDYQELDNLVKAISDFIVESNGKMY